MKIVRADGDALLLYILYLSFSLSCPDWLLSVFFLLMSQLHMCAQLVLPLLFCSYFILNWGSNVGSAVYRILCHRLSPWSKVSLFYCWM